LVHPDAKIWEDAIARAMNSVMRRPSSRPNSIDQTMPSGSPLKKRNTMFNGAGTSAKQSSAS
jgi:hypothetical protein